MRRAGRRVAAALAAAALAGCFGPALGEPQTALERQRELYARGDLDDTAKLGKVIVGSDQVPAADRAEAAFLAGEADFALGNHGRAFERYRYVLENAPWSEHAAVIEDRLYAIGEAFFLSDEYSGWFGDRGRGVAALETLQAHFRTSDRADDALMLVGDYFASEHEYPEAALSYLRLVDTYPDSEWAERCLWLAGHCRLTYAQGPKYDRNDLLRAREVLQRSIATHPRGVAVQEAKADLASCEEQLAAAELYVAEFYRGRGNAMGEVMRLANAALLYPRTEGGQVASARLLAMGLDPEALKGDRRRQSTDNVRVSRPLWEQERDRDPDASRTGLGVQ